MQRTASWAAVVVGGAMGVALGACDRKVDQQACLALRGEAFDIINEPHTCDGDVDCALSEWPGCAKPVSNKNRARIGPVREKFTQGRCVEEKTECRTAPEVYCKQGLCVFREMAGMENPTR